MTTPAWATPRWVRTAVSAGLCSRPYPTAAPRVRAVGPSSPGGPAGAGAAPAPAVLTTSPVPVGCAAGRPGSSRGPRPAGDPGGGRGRAPPAGSRGGDGGGGGGGSPPYGSGGVTHPARAAARATTPSRTACSA